MIRFRDQPQFINGDTLRDYAYTPSTKGGRDILVFGDPKLNKQ